MLFYAVSAKGFTLATLAVLARPDRVEMVGCGIDQREVVGQNTRLEVAFAIGLHTDTRARKICRANICHFAIENHHLEMDSWAESAFQPFEKSRMLVEIILEIRTWLLGVQQSHLHASPDEHIKHRKERLTVAADLDV